jgi:hypothetical protein
VKYNQQNVPSQGFSNAEFFRIDSVPLKDEKLATDKLACWKQKLSHYALPVR